MMKRIPSHWNIFLRESVFKLGRKELSLFCTGKITYFATSWNEGSQGKFSYREKILQLHLSWLSYKKFIPQLKEKLLFVFCLSQSQDQEHKTKIKIRFFWLLIQGLGHWRKTWWGTKMQQKDSLGQGAWQRARWTDSLCPVAQRQIKAGFPSTGSKHGRNPDLSPSPPPTLTDGKPPH